MSFSSSGGNQGSFLPEDYVRGKGEQRANILVLTLFTIVMLATGAAFAFNLQRQRQVAAENREVTDQFEAEHAKFKQMRQLEQRRTELMESAHVVTALVDRVPRSVLLGELTRTLPDGVSLVAIELEGERYRPPPARKVEAGKGSKAKVRSLSKKKDKDGEEEPEKPKIEPPRFVHTLTIDGVAELNTDIADYLDALKRSPLLSGVELQYIQETMEAEVQVRKFRITSSLARTADASEVAGVVETTLREGDALEEVSNVPTEDN